MSWLLSSEPPLDPADNGLGWTSSEAKLWWAVVRQAAWDVWRAPQPVAWDAADFLRSSGAHLVHALFGVEVEVTRAELVKLMRKSRSLRKLTLGQV